MLRAFSQKKELYSRILEAAQKLFGEQLLGLLVFGSTIYMGRGDDIDIIAVINWEPSPKQKLALEYKLASTARRLLELGMAMDVHVLGFKQFTENLVPGSFLSGLALGFEILVDRKGIREAVLEFLEKLSREKHVLHNKYGSWSLGHHARIILGLIKRHEEKL